MHKQIRGRPSLVGATRNPTPAFARKWELLAPLVAQGLSRKAVPKGATPVCEVRGACGSLRSHVTASQGRLAPRIGGRNIAALSVQSPVTTSLNYVRFAYRPTLDVVVAESNSPLETPDEFERCYAEYAQYFGSKFPDRKVDIIFDLSNFRIGAGMASEFTKMRAELMRNFARLTYRVGVASAARGAMLMGTVRHGLPTNECSSIDGAIAALVADREALAGVGRHLETAYRVRHEAKGRADVSGSRWGHGHSGIAEVQSIASFRDRWTLVDSFEHDGQRYILARSSRATGPDMEVLSEREREVVIQAMAGQHNKAIAYELGLAMSTVRVLMARAALKLGARSRKDLLDKARSIAEMRDKPLD